MNKWEIIKGPIITEKSNDLLENEGKYTFKVALEANKVEIKQAIEAIFNVKVVSVNILNTKPKAKRVGKYTGTTKVVRKAIVKIAEGQDINLFGE